MINFQKNLSDIPQYLGKDTLNVRFSVDTPKFCIEIPLKSQKVGLIDELYFLLIFR